MARPCSELAGNTSGPRSRLAIARRLGSLPRRGASADAEPFLGGPAFPAVLLGRLVDRPSATGEGGNAFRGNGLPPGGFGPSGGGPPGLGHGSEAGALPG